MPGTWQRPQQQHRPRDISPNQLNGRGKQTNCSGQDTQGTVNCMLLRRAEDYGIRICALATKLWSKPGFDSRLALKAEATIEATFEHN